MVKHTSKITAQKMKFSIKHFLSKCDQISRRSVNFSKVAGLYILKAADK